MDRDCHEISRHIEFYVLGALDSQTSLKVEAHLHHCAQCQELERQCRRLLCIARGAKLLLQLAQHFHTELDGVPVIGDALRDLQAAAAVNARPILVRTGKGSKTEPELPADFSGVEVYDDLAGAARALIAEAR